MSFILLLEDEDLQIKLVTDLLKYKLKMDVVATKYLDEAIILVRDNPALIISDIVLLIKPNIYATEFNNDGIKFAQAIKENPDTRHIPFILRSTLPLKDFNITLQNTKADEFVIKDSGINELLKVLKKHISH